MSGKDNTSKINEIGSTTHFQCPMLKGANYTTWAIRMQIILEANGLWEMIEPNEKTQADNKKDKTAIAFIYQALPEEQLLQITKHKTAKAIWDALKTRHIGEERVQQARLQTLKSDFEMLHMKEDETIDTFTEKLTTLNIMPPHCHKRDQRQQRREASNLVEEELEPTLLMASTSFNKTQRKSSKDTPTYESIRFSKDYDDKDSKFGESILEEDGGHDQDYNKLSGEDQQGHKKERKKT
ncbi:zinc finger, CCHC-type containing protein [Tanacetum coccineum]